MPVGSYSELLARQAVARGQDPVFEFGDETVNLFRLDRRANRAARGLKRLGVVPGSRLALMLPDSPEFVYALFGALRIGAAVVPIPAAARGEVLAELLARAQAPVLVTHNDLYKSFRRVAKQAPAIKRVAVSLRDASPVLKIFPGVDIMQDWFEMLSPDPLDTGGKKLSPSLVFLTDENGVEIVSGTAGLKKLEAAARAVLSAGDRIQPGGPFSGRHFLTATLPAALLAGAVISLPAESDGHPVG